jgi:hypothetical protein
LIDANIRKFSEEIKTIAEKYGMTYQDISRSLVMVFNPDKTTKPKSKRKEPIIVIDECPT